MYLVTIINRKAFGNTLNVAKSLSQMSSKCGNYLCRERLLVASKQASFMASV